MTDRLDPRTTAALLLLALALLGVGTAVAFRIAASRPPASLGLVNGELRPCPDTPNCVSTLAEPADELRYISPIRITGTPAKARRELREALDALPGVTLRRDEAPYLHAEASTPSGLFVDDLEFLIDADAGLLHFRSASRVGRSDLGANRRRMERIRRQMAVVSSQ